MSIHADLNELVATSGNADTPESAEAHDAHGPTE